MKHFIIVLYILSAMNTASAKTLDDVHDEASLQIAVSIANKVSSISEIAFRPDSSIILYAPVIYSGSQPIQYTGNNAIIDGKNVGNYFVDKDLSASTDDGTLLFNTASKIEIDNLTVKNSATRGIVVNIPADAQGIDSAISLDRVNISNSALHGLHIDDNSGMFDDGIQGSGIGINLNISHSKFIGNGIGAIDFDGIRIDERSRGNIHALIRNTHLNGNGGDGIEMDEAGEGDVEVTLVHVTLNNNGFYNKADLEDGFDIDEAGPGDIETSFYDVEVNNNKDEGLDFDEAGEGDADIKLRYVHAGYNSDEGIKIDEQGEGEVDVKIYLSTATGNGDDGIKITEINKGKIDAEFYKVTANNNAKYGISIEQWSIEDEQLSGENDGSLKTTGTTLSGNAKGNNIKTVNMKIK